MKFIKLSQFKKRMDGKFEYLGKTVINIANIDTIEETDITPKDVLKDSLDIFDEKDKCSIITIKKGGEYYEIYALESVDTLYDTIFFASK